MFLLGLSFSAALDGPIPISVVSEPPLHSRPCGRGNQQSVKVDTSLKREIFASNGIVSERQPES